MDSGGAMYTLNETEVHAVCYGVDLYNQCLTGGVSKTLNNRATDADHVPCVLIRGGYVPMIVDNRGGVGLLMKKWGKPTSITTLPIPSPQEITSSHS